MPFSAPLRRVPLLPGTDLDASYDSVHEYVCDVERMSAYRPVLPAPIKLVLAGAVSAYLWASTRPEYTRFAWANALDYVASHLSAQAKTLRGEAND